MKNRTGHAALPTRLYHHLPGKRWESAYTQLGHLWPYELETFSSLVDFEKSKGEDLFYPAVCDECALRLGLRW